MRERITKKKKINITIDEPVVNLLDKYSEDAGFTRSGLINWIIRQYFREELGITSSVQKMGTDDFNRT